MSQRPGGVPKSAVLAIVAGTALGCVLFFVWIVQQPAAPPPASTPRPTTAAPPTVARGAVQGTPTTSLAAGGAASVLSPSPAATAAPPPTAPIAAAPNATAQIATASSPAAAATTAPIAAAPSPTAPIAAGAAPAPSPQPPDQVANVPANPIPPAPNDVHANDVARQIQAILQAGVPDGSALALTTVGGQPIRAWHEADSKRIAASTIKLPILIGVLVGNQTGQLDLNEQYTIRQSDVVAGTGELQGAVGRTLSYGEIMRLMITRSDNVGANVLLRRLGKGDAASGMMRVNRVLTEEGYHVTHVERTMIDLDAQRRGIENWVSAEELARMLDEIRRGTLLRDVSPSISARALALLRERGALDREWMGLKLDQGWSLAHINGTLDTVRNDAGIISGPGGREFILVVCQDRLTSTAVGEQRIADVASKIQRLLANEAP